MVSLTFVQSISYLKIFVAFFEGPSRRDFFFQIPTMAFNVDATFSMLFRRVERFAVDLLFLFGLSTDDLVFLFFLGG